MKNFDKRDGMVEVFCRYIRKNGRIIYPKNGKLFHFWVPAEKAQNYGA